MSAVPTATNWYLHLASASAEHPKVSLRDITVSTMFVAGKHDILASAEDMRTAADCIVMARGALLLVREPDVAAALGRFARLCMWARPRRGAS